MARILLAATFAALAAPALAAGTFTLPSGCEGFMTVQLKSCTVGNYYRCSGDAAGDSRSTYFDGEGPYFSSRIDAETRWIESFDHFSGEWDYLDEVATDHASFSTLLATGRDDFDFTTTTDRGETRRYVGWDRLTGETLAIDGVPLERTRFDVMSYAADGRPVWRRSGQQFIHRGWRLFLADRESFETETGDIIPRDDTPVDFALPGDAGFMTTEPRYGCDLMMTEAPRPQTIAFQGRP